MPGQKWHTEPHLPGQLAIDHPNQKQKEPLFQDFLKAITIKLLLELFQGRLFTTTMDQKYLQVGAKGQTKVKMTTGGRKEVTKGRPECHTSGSAESLSLAESK